MGPGLLVTVSSRRQVHIWQQVHRVMHLRRQVHGGKHMVASTWRQAYGGKYMAASIWWQVHGGKYIRWQQVHGGKHMAARSQGPCQQIQAASLGRKLSRPQPLATGSWQQGQIVGP